MATAEQIKSQISDDDASRLFANRLMAEFKADNILNGNIDGLQAIWVHHRMRAMELPSIKLPTGDELPVPMTVDVLNMVVSGDMEAAWIALNSCVPDDMTQPFHFLNQARVNVLKDKIAEYLGWV